MKAPQHKNGYKSAWLLLAAAAMAIAMLSPAEISVRSAAANPVIQFLTSHAETGSLSAADVAQLLQDWSAQQSKTATQGPGLWQAILPIFFIGLIAPLSLAAFIPASSGTRALAYPALPSSFQRPPPSRLF